MYLPFSWCLSKRKLPIYSYCSGQPHNVCMPDIMLQEERLCSTMLFCYEAHLLMLPAAIAASRQRHFHCKTLAMPLAVLLLVPWLLS